MGRGETFEEFTSSMTSPSFKGICSQIVKSGHSLLDSQVVTVAEKWPLLSMTGLEATFHLLCSDLAAGIHVPSRLDLQFISKKEAMYPVKATAGMKHKTLSA